MKSRHLINLPKTLVICLAPLVASGVATAAIVNTNESNTTAVWTLPSGTNLLNGNTATPPPAQPNHGGTDVTSATWATVTDNAIGSASNKLASVAPNNNNTVTFPLDISVNSNGYNISQFDFYGAWPDSGRDNLNFTVKYSTVDAPTTFVTLAVVANQTSAPVNSTHTRLTENSTGILASRVHSVQLLFGSPTGQENGWVGYREFIALGTAVPLANPLTWTGNGGSSGNADWVASADDNWKDTTAGTPANFSALSPLTFDSTGINRNITVPSPLTASSVKFANDATASYSLGGSLITITNDLVSSGAGSATITAPVKATTGVSLTGSGSLLLSGELEAPGISVSGTGTLTLSSANFLLTGNVAVSSGTLVVADNSAVERASLVMTGGTTRFTTASPLVSTLAGTAGSIILGNAPSVTATDLAVGIDNSSTSTFAGNISEASGVTGSFSKLSSSSLTLAGVNTYTGNTFVGGGILEFGKVASYYNGAVSTTGKLIVDPGATASFVAGGTGEFTGADLDAIDLSGFGDSSYLGLNGSAGTTTTVSRAIGGPILVEKTGTGIIKLTGANTFTGDLTVLAGALDLGNPTGASVPGMILLGNGSADVWLNASASNQFAPTSVISFNSGNTVTASKFNLRGTNQTIAGLSSSTATRIGLVQNDETTAPGYTTNPGPATLTLDSDVDYSYYGIIRNQDGGALSIVKEGTGTQEFINGYQAFAHTGQTTVNEGTVRLAFNTGATANWTSPIQVNPAGKLSLGAFPIDQPVWMRMAISGPGPVEVSGTGKVLIVNALNSNTGGTNLVSGALEYYPSGGAGNGNGPGQTCAAGAMIPTNVISVQSGAKLSMDGIAPLGQSLVQPEYAPTVKINEGGSLLAANAITFLANLKLDGGTVDIGNAGNGAAGGFNTNLAVVGTLEVGGTSTVASSIVTSGTGANSNMSLGTPTYPGTTFLVPDVTGSAAPDLTVSAVFRNAQAIASGLTKTGAGTMTLAGTSTYTGATTVTAGVLSISTAYLADGAGVSIAAAGTLDLNFTGSDTVSTLTLAGTQVAAGTYGSLTNSTPGIIQTARITGTGALTVTSGPVVTDPYVSWSSAIPVEADRDRSDDPDQDGLTNIKEYLFGTSPVASTGSLVATERSGSNLIVRWSQRNTGTFILQESTNLVSWTTSSVSVINAADQTGLYSSDYTRKEATVPVGTGTKFVRVFATE